MNGIKYLNQNGIKWFPVNVEVINGEKVFNCYTEEGQRPNYTKDFDNNELISKRQKYKNYKTIVIDTHDIQQMDIDSEEAKEITKKMKAPYFKSVRKGLPHYFFKLGNKEEWSARFKVNDIHKDIDILNGQFSFASIDFEVIDADIELVNINIPTKIQTKVNDNKSFIKPENINTILDIIDIKYADEWDSWFRIGVALFNCDYGVEVFHEFSKKSDKYSSNCVNKLWNQIKNNKVSEIGFGTLCYYAKISDEAKFELLKPTYWNDIQKTALDRFLQSGSHLTHSVAAKIFYEAYKDKYVYSNGYWYELTKGGLYKKLTKDAKTILSKQLIDYLQDLIIAVIQTVQDQTQRKALWSANGTLENNGFKASAVEEMKGIFLDRNLIEELDKSTTKIGFVNGVYDLEKSEFNKGTTEDKVSMSTHYEFNSEINEDNQIFLEELFNGYFECPQTAHYFKKHLGSLLEGGNREEKCYFWIGNGRNGKGITDLMLRNTLGDYYVTLNNNYYTIADKHNNSPHPELLPLENSRISMTHEPEGSTKYLTSKFKSLSGGDPISVRDCNAGKDDIRTFIPTFKPVIQTNHLPGFTDIDLGGLLRIVVINFDYTFYDESNYDETEKYAKKADYNLKNKLRNINNDFFHFLLKYYRLYKSEGLSESPAIKNSINKYKKEIDSVKTFMEEAIIKTDSSKDRIKTTDLLFHHNGWSSHKSDRERFSKRIISLGYKPQRLTVDGLKSMCITNAKWNEGFKSDNQCLIDDGL